MIPSIRERYNREFTQERYEAFLQHLFEMYHQDVVFRVAETPIFIDKALGGKLIEASEAIVDVICQENFKQLTENAIPKGLRVQHENDHPHFICIDFGICRDADGSLSPMLIEMQGFASLYAWEDIIGEKYKQFFYCPEGFSQHFNGMDSEAYFALLRRTILGDCAPEQVVLMDLKPHEQKTRIDFYCTEDKLGISIVCLSDLIQKGRKLFYMRDGKETEIKRIYNRLIFDDLHANKDFHYSVDLFSDLDVTWVAHPNWFYRISKYTMPLLQHRFVPETRFLNQLTEIPSNLEEYVLKPLFSFSGMGVVIDVTKADIEQVKDPENWILQRKVTYAEALQSPEGGVKCEIRMMYLWPEGEKRPLLATNLARMSRGKMIGVRYNKDFNWVGGNIAFFEQ